MKQASFKDFALCQPLQMAIAQIGYQTPTAIQCLSIPEILAGHDLLAIAQTGTGKTAAFGLALMEKLRANETQEARIHPRALVLTPTRELALQIHKNFRSYSKGLRLKCVALYGGVSTEAQINELQRGADIVIATPGRLIDILKQDQIRMNHIQYFVLDEADRMLDLGFLPELRRVLKRLPRKRQNLFFSATMPEEIEDLARTLLVNPKKVQAAPPATPVDQVEQWVMYVEDDQKQNLLMHWLKTHKPEKTLIFVQTKIMANRLFEVLNHKKVRATIIHGNKSQSARQNAIASFSANNEQVMIATDIASRGIDIAGITHVINYELSHVAEHYVHRIGRTARAGAAGQALSFSTADEKSYVAHIEKTTGQKLTPIIDHPYHSEAAANARIVSVGKAKAKIEADRPVLKPRNSRTKKKRARS